MHGGNEDLLYSTRQLICELQELRTGTGEEESFRIK
jgi:hypothetical protein